MPSLVELNTCRNSAPIIRNSRPPFFCSSYTNRIPQPQSTPIDSMKPTHLNIPYRCNPELSSARMRKYAWLLAVGLVAAPAWAAENATSEPATPASVQAPVASGTTKPTTDLPPVVVTAEPIPPPFAGGQVARGARIGVLGDGDFMEVPVNIVSFTSEFRDNTQSQSVSDMLKYSVSVQNPQAGPVNTTDVIYVRGFNIGTYDGTFDGLPGLLGRMPPVLAVERVELLLGANAFANGQPYSVGGNINIVPKRAGDATLIRLGADYRTERIFGGTIDAGTRFGPDNVFGLRASLGYEEGETELEGGDRRAFSRAVAFDARTEKASFSIDYMGNDRYLPAEAWFVINPGVKVPDADRASRNFRQPWTFYEDTWDAVVGRGTWEFLPDWTVTAAYGHMWTTVERLSQVSEIIDNAGNMQDAYGGTYGASKERREAYAWEVHLKGKFDTGPITHRPRVGFTAYGDEGAYVGSYPDTYYPFFSNIYHPTHYPAPRLPGLKMPSSSDYDSRTSNMGVVISDELSAWDDRVRVIVGARNVSYESEYRDGSGWSGDPVKDVWTPAYGLVVRPVDWMSLYANRLESLDAGYRVQEPAANAGEVLPPLPADQTEVGVKMDFGKIGATISAFEIDKPSYFLDPNTGIEDSNGRQVNRGIELSLFGEVNPGLRIYSSATFLDPKMKETFGGEFDGKYAVSAARFLASLYADWDIPGVKGLALMGGMSYTGSIYNDEANTQKLDPWVRFDLGLRYQTRVFDRPATFRVNVDNVFDRQYWVSERGTIYMAPERTIAVSATIDF